MLKVINIHDTCFGKCNQATSILNDMVSKSGIPAEVIKVEDIEDIIDVPIKVVDENLKIKGKCTVMQQSCK